MVSRLSTRNADMELSKALQEVERKDKLLEEMEGELDEARRQVCKLKNQVQELIHVNGQWDIEYSDLREAFECYRTDAKRAQSENHDLIANLKAEKEEISAELEMLKRRKNSKQGGDSNLASSEVIVVGTANQHHQIREREREGEGGRERERLLEREVRRLRAELEEVRRRRGGGGGRIETEELVLLRQQLTAYKEDFEAERRDRERMKDESQSMALRYEAEITSLRIQLDRCRTELAHYSAEATRLGQQLRLKTQHEDELFRKQLESKGYLSRSPGGGGRVPPLDPFVENDIDDRQQHQSRQGNYYHHLKVGTAAPPYDRSSSRSDPHLYNHSTSNAAVVPSSSSSSNGSNPPPSRHSSANASSGSDSRYRSPYHHRDQHSGASNQQHHQQDFQYRGSSSSSTNNSSSRGCGYYAPPDNRRHSPIGLLARDGEAAAIDTAMCLPNSAPPILVNGGDYHRRHGNDVLQSERRPVVARNELVVSSTSKSPNSSRGPSPVPNGPMPVPRRRPKELIIPGVSTTTVGVNGGSSIARAPPKPHPSTPPISPSSSYGNPNVSHIPPLQTRGKHVCPRCARRFTDRTECTEHKLRCLQ